MIQSIPYTSIIIIYLSALFVITVSAQDPVWCSVCGSKKHVSNKDFTLVAGSLPGIESNNITCNAVEIKGQTNLYNADKCNQLPALIEAEDKCDCDENTECNVCGAGKSVTDNDRVVVVVGYAPLTCEDWDNYGKNSHLTPAQCNYVRLVTTQSCACKIDNPGTPGICFSGSNTVQVQDRGIIQMEDLKIGDYVMVEDDKYSRVFSFGHLNPDVEATFLQIHVNGIDVPLEISHDHLLYLDNKIVKAQDVQVGDMLGQNQVYRVEEIKRQGVYYPITETGNIVVSGVLASCYVGLFQYSPALVKWVFHTSLSPLRLLCTYNFNICMQETYIHGFSDFYYNLIQLALKLSDFHVLIQYGVTVMIAPFLIAAYVFEQVLVSSFFPVLVFSLVFGTFLYFTYYRRHTVWKSKTV